MVYEDWTRNNSSKLNIIIIIIVIDMFNQLNHIAHLNEQLTRKDNELARLRASRTRHLNQIDHLHTQVADFRNDNVDLVNQINTLERRNRDLKEKLTKFQPNHHYKPYSDLASTSGRQNRRKDYRRIFNNVLDTMTDISRANINVYLGGETFNFLWRKNQPDPVPGTDNDDSDSEIFDVAHSDIFDPEGNYVKPFLRSIIYVMDKHKISHEAYHETRMVTKGFMPPIHIIKEEKSKMSEEIPYIKHPTVCSSKYNFDSFKSASLNYYCLHRACYTFINNNMYFEALVLILLAW